MAVAHTDYATVLHTHLADQQLAHILSRILQPRSQAEVPSVQALLNIPELAKLAVLDMNLQDKGRASMQAAYHAAYAAGLEASVLLSQLHCETHSSSGSSSAKPLSAGQQVSLLHDRYAAAHSSSCHLAPAATYGPNVCGFNHPQLLTAKHTVLQLQHYLQSQQRGAHSSDAGSVGPSTGTSSSIPTSDAGSTHHASDCADSSPDSPCGPTSPLATVTSGSIRGWAPQWGADTFAAAHRAADLEAQLFAAADAAAAAWPKLSSPCSLPANAVSCADLEAQLLASAGVSF